MQCFRLQAPSLGFHSSDSRVPSAASRVQLIMGPILWQLPGQDPHPVPAPSQQQPRTAHTNSSVLRLLKNLFIL